MGRQTLLALVCWLTVSITFGDKRKHAAALIDNVSEESAPRLYRDVQLGMYASAAPYGAHSFHLPTFIAAPKTAASQVAPVKENYLNHLTDSYGNKFVGTPQLSSYKIAYPQQFVALQTKLPDHLAQPLVAASANFQFKPSNGQFFGASYNVPSLHGPAPIPLHHFPTFGQFYGGKVQSLAPSTGHGQTHGIPNAQQQSTNNKAVITNTKEQQIIIGKPKLHGTQEVHHGPQEFQRFQEAPHSSYNEPILQRTQEKPHYTEEKSQRIQNSPQSHNSQPKQQSSDDEESYQHVQLPHYENKYQIIQDDPHSHQFQRIQEHHIPHGEVKFQQLHEAPPTEQIYHTYDGTQGTERHGGNLKARHESNGKLQAAPGKQTVTYINDINGEKTLVELDTKPNLPLLDLTLLEPLTFDNPLVPQVQHFLPRINQATYQKLPEAISKKKQKKTAQPKYPKKNNIPKKTETHHETLDEAPEIVYEIDLPNYKETVKQKAVSYDKVTQSEPEHYSYGSRSEKEPVTYSYSRSSKDPAQLRSVHYHSNDPSHLIYTFSPEEQAEERESPDAASHHSESENENESSRESDDEEPRSHQRHQHTEQYKENPRSADEQPDHPRPHQHHQHTEQYKENPRSAEEQPDHPRSHQRHQQTEQYKENSRSAEEQTNHPHSHQRDQNTEQYKDDPRSAEEPTDHSRSHQRHQHTEQYKENSRSAEEQADHPRSHQRHQHTEQYKENPRSAEEQTDHPRSHQRHQHTEQYKENPRSAEEHTNHKSPKEKDNYHKQNENKKQEIEERPPKYYSEPAHITSENINFQPILKEYENNIRLLTAPSASIKVDPNQHIQHPKPTPQALVNHHEKNTKAQHPHTHSANSHEEQPQSSDEPQRSHYHSNPPQSENYNTPAPHIHETSKRIIIQEETPDEMHMLREQMREEVIKREENSEEDFEKGYQDAAYGFPAYNRKLADTEKDIFDPESYGVSRDQPEYDFNHTPLQQYQEEGDAFPKETRSRYKDARDKTMQNYYSDFSVSKPESMLERYQNKAGYYKLYKERKPDYIVDDEESNKKPAKSAKYSAAPSYAYNKPDDKSKSYYGHAKPTQQLYEYDYAKSTPRDNSAFASRPYQSFKSRTSFVEPQFQYGFEPVAIPKLLDSELAAMATNDSPESEKPGMRKKIYKENWYIKKTSTSAGSPTS